MVEEDEHELITNHMALMFYIIGFYARKKNNYMTMVKKSRAKKKTLNTLTCSLTSFHNRASIELFFILPHLSSFSIVVGDVLEILISYKRNNIQQLTSS